MMRIEGYLFALLAWLLFAAGAAAEKTHYRIGYDQLGQSVEAALVDAGAGDRIKAILIGPSVGALHESSKPLALEVAFLTHDERSHRWQAEVAVLENGATVKTISVNGRYTAMMEVPVMARHVRRGEVIGAEDVTSALMASHRLRDTTIFDADALIGKSPRRGLRQRQPVSAHEIEAPRIIEKGDFVSLRYRTPFLEIQTVAEALEDAPEGKSISVRNADSGHVLRATVVAPGIAEVNRPMLLSQRGGTR